MGDNEFMDIQAGQRYKHYKGSSYVVIAVGVHTETEEEMIVYKQEGDDPRVWIRPRDMFSEHVIIDDAWVPRFTLIS